MAQVFTTITPESLTRAADTIGNWLREKTKSGAVWIIKLTDEGVTIKLRTRTLEQNALLWAMLTDLSEQCTHFGQRYTPDDWKDILTASLAGELRMTPSLDGRRMVLLGLRTSKMSIKHMTDLIDLGHAHGAANGVVWDKNRRME